MNLGYFQAFSSQQPSSKTTIKTPTLYSTCLTYICANLDLICQRLSQKHHNNLEFRDKSIKLNHIISEDLLERLCLSNKLNDSTLSLFASSNPIQQTCLKKFHIRNCLLNKDSLRFVLKQHKIDDICINNVQFLKNQPPNNHHNHHTNNNDFTIHDDFLITNITAISGSNTPQPLCINDLTENLNEWSQKNLKSLNVARNQPLFGTILINLSKLKNLSRLNVSYTCFNNHSLDIIAQDLTNLEFLDISGTKVNDLTPLTRLKHKLRLLHLYNMRASLGDELVPLVCGLEKLNSLDLSCDVSNKIFADMSLSLFDVNYLLDRLTLANLEDLKFLDISGKVGIKLDSLM
jgi:hypothetical protein